MRIVRRMARMQVYLPDEMYARVKADGLPASELLQRAVRAELRRRELEAAADAYLAELIDEVGEPTETDLDHARDIVRRMAGEPERATG
jgi:post-segregation antitoxin (ccd killing protein)